MENNKTLKSIVVLTIIVLVISQTLSFLYSKHQLRIEDNRTNYLNAQVNKMLKDYLPKNQPLDEVITVSDFIVKKVYPIKDSNSTTAAQIFYLTAPNGYSGEIDYLVLIENDFIKDIEIIKHKETPGLGDQIEKRKSNWLESFIDKPINQKLSVDAITGASISSNAITQSLGELANFYEKKLSKIVLLIITKR